MRADVVVVGLGPAGASAALRLAQMGLEVVALDRAEFPRDKPCGEFLNPGARKLLREMGVEARGTPIGCVRLHLGEEPLEIPIRDEAGEVRPALSVRRTDFDASLVEAARASGVEVRTGRTVRRPLIERDEVVGVEGDGWSIRARAVIAADGAHSALARALDVVRPIGRLQRLAVVAHAERLPLQGTPAVEMFPGDGAGVMGIMPQGEGAVMSSVAPKAMARRLSKGALEFARERLRRATAHEAEGLGVRTTACFGHRLTRCWAPGIVFAGDAAHFVDPFTGQGMHHAIEGGLLAAEAVEACLRRGFSLSKYADLRRELGRRYAFCDAIQALMHVPALAWASGRVLAARPRLADRLISTVADLLPPHSLLTPRAIATLLLP